MVTVPFFCPDTPPLKNNPVFLYSSDGFQKPYPFKADVAVAIDDVFDQKLEAIHELASQHLRRRGQRQRGVTCRRSRRPATTPAARPGSASGGTAAPGREADRFRDALIEWYGEERGKAVKYRRSLRDLRIRPPAGRRN